MKVAYFDCFSGIAGDMALAALLDCGVPLDELKQGLSSLPISGWDIEAEDVLRSGIHAKNVRVLLDGKTDEDELQEAVGSRQPADGHHHHEHGHDHREHGHHHHEHEHEHDHHEDQLGTRNSELGTHAHGRSMAEIRALIEQSTLSLRVQQMSLQIFGKIAEAEAYLHHSTPEEIHFHEIGGVDSLMDICGVAWCLEYLGVEEIYCSALPHSTGFVDCAHGRMPVPAPATLEILKGAPWTPTELKGELVTPTGAGIVSLSKFFGAMPQITVEKVGNGAGKKTLADRPNLLRVVIGEKTAAESTPATLEGLQTETLAVLECNIDDMNPEFYEIVSEKLFEAGALDVWLQSVQMKKNRPGTLLGVLCPVTRRDALVSLLLRETTSLGVRYTPVERLSLPRASQTVHTDFGDVRVKIADWPQGAIWRVTPEYSDVARLAKQHDLPARQIYNAAVAAAENARASE
jgi:uncharacterized protein (TIGR00299 family) protein